MARRSVTLSIRLSPEQRDEIDRIAERDGRSRANQLAFWIREALREEQRRTDPVAA